MTKRDWAVLACKVLALWILFQGIGGVISFVGIIIESFRSAGGEYPLLWGMGPVVITGFGALLWVSAPWFAEKVFPEDACGKVTPADGEALLSVAVLAIGASIFMSGSVGLINAVITALAARHIDAGDAWPRWYGGIGSSVVKMVVGVWFIGGNRGVINLLQRCRTLGWRGKAEAAAATAEQAEQTEQGEREHEGPVGR